MLRRSWREKRSAPREGDVALRKGARLETLLIARVDGSDDGVENIARVGVAPASTPYLRPEQGEAQPQRT